MADVCASGAVGWRKRVRVVAHTKIAACVVTDVPKHVEDVVASAVAISSVQLAESGDVTVEPQQRWRHRGPKPAVVPSGRVLIPISGLAILPKPDVVEVFARRLSYPLVLPVRIPAGRVATRLVMVLRARRHAPHAPKQVGSVLEKAAACGWREV
jgi:hypothetical protein